LPLLLGAALCLGVPHLFVAPRELQGLGFKFADWEGANYLIVAAVPLVVAFIEVVSSPIRDEQRSPA